MLSIIFNVDIKCDEDDCGNAVEIHEGGGAEQTRLWRKHSIEKARAEGWKTSRGVHVCPACHLSKLFGTEAGKNSTSN